MCYNIHTEIPPSWLFGCGKLIIPYLGWNFFFFYDGSSHFSTYTFKNGEKVAFNTKDATRPDIIRKINDKFEAIEVKHWDLENNIGGLCTELKRQVEDRVKNLPENYNQRVVLDVTGRGYTKEFVLERIAIIQEKLNEVYYNLPINVVGV